jgi:rhamnosyltransferase subunit B
MTHAGRFFRTALAACEALGERGLFLTKHPHVLPARLPASVRHCAFAPLRALLPRCTALVHHGGVGTTAAALESGCPQLVLPLAWDQPDNAERVRKLGVGLTLGPHHRDSERLSRALARLMTAGFRERCRAAARRAAADRDGFQLAADWVEVLARQDMMDGGRRPATSIT